MLRSGTLCISVIFAACTCALVEAAPLKIPKELLEKRRDAARKVFEQKLALVKGGQGLLSAELFGWSERWLEAELALADKQAERIKPLRDHLDRVRGLERMAANFAKSGMVLQADADAATYYRVETEIRLLKEGVVLKPAKGAKGKDDKAPKKPAAGDSKAPGDRVRDLQDQVALAEKRVAIKRAAAKVAELQKRIAAAKLASVRGQLKEAQAAESFAEKQYKRFQLLLQQRAVEPGLIDERRVQWEAAKARREASEAEISQHELQVAQDEARSELAQLEAQEAELRLEQWKARLESKR